MKRIDSLLSRGLLQPKSEGFVLSPSIGNDIEARKKLNEEIVKANRINGYACWWPMLLPKYAIKIWEVILPKIGVMR